MVVGQTAGALPVTHGADPWRRSDSARVGAGLFRAGDSITLAKLARCAISQVTLIQVLVLRLRRR